MQHYKLTKDDCFKNKIRIWLLIKLLSAYSSLLSKLISVEAAYCVYATLYNEIVSMNY
jgi:hypothetical protein